MGRKKDVIIEGLSRMLVILAHGVTDAYLDSVKQKELLEKKRKTRK